MQTNSCALVEMLHKSELKTKNWIMRVCPAFQHPSVKKKSIVCLCIEINGHKNAFSAQKSTCYETLKNFDKKGCAHADLNMTIWDKIYF